MTFGIGSVEQIQEAKEYTNAQMCAIFGIIICFLQVVFFLACRSQTNIFIYYIRES